MRSSSSSVKQYCREKRVPGGVSLLQNTVWPLKTRLGNPAGGAKPLSAVEVSVAAGSESTFGAALAEPTVAAVACFSSDR